MGRAPVRSFEPIAALATPPGAAERAVVRLSGEGLIARADGLLPAGCPRPGAERAALDGRLEWCEGSTVPVRVLVFPAPGSATGEDVIELHLPGSPPVIERVLEGLRRRGVRSAEPGEFTRRAFLHGRLDLTQAEAVLELVQARSSESARAAARVLAGGLGDRLQKARDALADALAELEASLDFEEGDAQDVRPEEIDALIARARAALQEGLAGEERRGAARNEWRIALHGAPNAGKSSLFRRLTGASALVSDQGGTTRDRLEAQWFPAAAESPWVLLDGPGAGSISVDERDAAARSLAAAAATAQAGVDLWWLVVDAADPQAELPRPPGGAPAMVVWTQLDRGRAVPEHLVARAAGHGPAAWVSAAAGTGLEELARLTAARFAEAESARAAGAATGQRHREALRRALEALTRAEQGLRQSAPADLLAEELRAALVAVGELIGRLTPEDLLDRVFSRFCIGK